MTQIINCRFQEYRLPEKPTRFDNWFMSVSETLGASGYRHDKCFTLILEYPELFLIPKSKFSVAGSLVGRIDKAEFEVLKWRFGFEKGDESVLDLDVREVKLSPLQRWFSNLSPRHQYALGAISVLLPLAIIGLGAYTIISYPDPRGFWIWFGQHVRGIVGWSLLVSLLVLDIWTFYKFRKSPFVQNVLLFLLSFSIFLIPLFWLQVSLPPQPLSGNPEEYIQYLDYLRTRLATFVLLLAGTIPWLTLFLKWFGLDLIASILGLWSKSLKDKKDKAAE